MKFVVRFIPQDDSVSLAYNRNRYHFAYDLRDAAKYDKVSLDEALTDGDCEASRRFYLREIVPYERARDEERQRRLARGRLS